MKPFIHVLTPIAAAAASAATEITRVRQCVFSKSTPIGQKETLLPALAFPPLPGCS
jgi:hypothetical protein